MVVVPVPMRIARASVVFTRTKDEMLIVRPSVIYKFDELRWNVGAAENLSDTISGRPKFRTGAMRAGFITPRWDPQKAR